MKAITYHITLDEPLLVTKLEGDPNSGISHDYIPGSVLRGALIGRHIATIKEGEVFDPATSPFFTDAVRFLNAYPLVDGVRALPAPLPLVTDKHATGAAKDDVKNQLFGDPEEPGKANGDRKEMGKAKSVEGFVRMNGGTLLQAKPKLQTAVHIARSRLQGRPQQGDGAIFRYQALEAGQVFVGVVLCDDDAFATTVADLLPENVTLTIGGARTAGYGRVTISNPTSSDNWSEFTDYSTNGSLVITLLSDAILRDAAGNPAPNVHALRVALGMEGAEIERAWVRTTTLGGFNRKWGLPLPQVEALVMGTVVKFKAGVSIPSDKLTAGIGERRNEGFGRIAVGWDVLGAEHLTLDKVETFAAPSAMAETAAVKDMRARVAKAKQQRDLTEKANNLAAGLRRNGIRNSQLNRLRAAVRSQMSGDAKAISDFVAEGNLRAKARQQFEKAMVDGKTLIQWATDNADKPTLMDAALALMIKKGETNDN